MDNLTGQRFGKLLVGEELPRYVTPRGMKHRQFACLCDCGKSTSVLAASLRAGRSRSCGCGISAAGRLRYTHGASRGFSHGAKRQGEYNSWAQMRSRCNDPGANMFEHYGGRGIRVCARWESFEAFMLDMGPRPVGHSLDRIDVHGDYEPTNCRWADASTQANNTSRTVRITLDGVTQSLKQWTEARGLSYKMVSGRLKRGWTPERALSTPSSWKSWNASAQ